jgi:two-component system, cell cycle response regulator
MASSGSRAQAEPDLGSGVEPSRSRERMKTLVADASAVQRSRAVLTITSGPDVGRVISLVRGEVTFGRSEECGVWFSDPSLSRVHAQVTYAVHEYVLTDRASTNGSFVNDRKVLSPTALRDGDHVRLGAETTLRFSMVDENEEQALRQMYESAARDALTGVSNRKCFDERLAAELAFATRHGTPLCLTLVDIDYFKRINDGFGHQAGDAVLRAVAAVLVRSIRAEDMVARYGGEEFAVIARGADLRGAGIMGERLRHNVSQEDVEHQGQRLRVTCSVGVASLACCSKDRDKAALIALADTRLYRAKQLGRNRVVNA